MANKIQFEHLLKHKKEMRPKLYTEKNELTKYALCCGYAQTRNNKTLTYIHGVYKVASLYEMEYFDTLKAARKYLYSGVIN